MVHRKAISAVCLSVLTWWFCIQSGFAQTLPKNQRATIKPSVVYMNLGETQKFKAVMIATRMMAAAPPKEVKWAVNDIPGGNSEVGTIDDMGVYTAPSALPSPREVHICADVPESANRYLFATVILGDGPPTYKQVGIWSEPLAKPEDRSTGMIDPHGLGLDKEGNILIADQQGHKVLRYSADGKLLGQIGSGRGSEPGYFTEPRIVGSDASGRIFVTDSKGDRPRIQVFDHEGRFLQIFGEKGRKPGMILRSHGIGFDPAQRLFVVDVDNMRVNVYSPEGEFLYEWGEEGLNPGQMNSPHAIFVDRNGDVFVTGYYGPTQKFNAEGDFVTAFCYGDPPDGPVYFHSMTGDRWGNIYVLVRNKEGYDGALQLGSRGERISIMKYNNNGDFVTSWGFSALEHRETTAVVDEQDRVYALFKGAREMGVEIFEEE